MRDNDSREDSEHLAGAMMNVMYKGVVVWRCQKESDLLVDVDGKRGDTGTHSREG